MDFKQIILDNLPEGVELTEKALKAFISDINKAVGEATVPKESYSKKTTELIEMRAELDGLKNEQAARAAEKETLKKAAADASAALEAEKADRANEKDAAAVDGLVAKLLETAGEDGVCMSAAAIPIALKQYDRGLVKRDKEGKVTNADDVVKHFREGDFKEFFGKTETQGANIGYSPANPNQPAEGQFDFNFAAVRPKPKNE